jgi:hypothetical protein
MNLSKIRTVVLAACLAAVMFAVPAHAAVPNPCGAPIRANGLRSLEYVAEWEAGSPVSQVIADTAKCSGRTFRPAMQAYLNQGDLNAHLTRGLRLWFSDLRVGH